MLELPKATLRDYSALFLGVLHSHVPVTVQDGRLAGTARTMMHMIRVERADNIDEWQMDMQYA